MKILLSVLGVILLAVLGYFTYLYVNFPEKAGPRIYDEGKCYLYKLESNRCPGQHEVLLKFTSKWWIAGQWGVSYIHSMQCDSAKAEWYRFTDELTGVIENDTLLWLHPIRSDSLSINQVAPYPYVLHGLDVGDTYQFAADLVFDDYQELGVKDQVLLSSYKKAGYENFQLEGKTIRAEKFIAHQVVEKYDIRTEFLFDSTYGFLRIHNDYGRGQYMTMTMTEVPKVCDNDFYGKKWYKQQTGMDYDSVKKR